jgi:hypothetical protein
MSFLATRSALRTSVRGINYPSTAGPAVSRHGAYKLTFTGPTLVREDVRVDPLRSRSVPQGPNGRAHP